MKMCNFFLGTSYRKMDFKSDKKKHAVYICWYFPSHSKTSGICYSSAQMNLDWISFCFGFLFVLQHFLILTWKQYVFMYSKPGYKHVQIWDRMHFLSQPDIMLNILWTTQSPFGMAVHVWGWHLNCVSFF